MKDIIKNYQECGISGKLGEDGKCQIAYHPGATIYDGSVQLLKPFCKEAVLNGIEVVWIGYQFNDGIDKGFRDACIEFFKDFYMEPRLVDDETDEYFYPPRSSNKGIHEADLYNLMIFSMLNLDIDDFSVDALIGPLTRNELTYEVHRDVRKYLSNSSHLTFNDVLKADTDNLTINTKWCLTSKRHGVIDDPEGLLTEDYLSGLQNNIRNSDDFSYGRDLKPTEIRRYVNDFAVIRRVNKALFDADKVLITDDFDPEYKALSDIVRIIRKYNKDCRIYIYTLIENSRESFWQT